MKICSIIDKALTQSRNISKLVIFTTRKLDQLINDQFHLTRTKNLDELTQTVLDVFLGVEIHQVEENMPFDSLILHF
jgi:hypothetical protein